MTISVLDSAMEGGKAALLACSDTAESSLDSLKIQNDTLFAAWQGTGAAGFREACDSVENALAIVCSTFMSVGEQVGAASVAFTEADSSSAVKLQGLG